VEKDDRGPSTQAIYQVFYEHRPDSFIPTWWLAEMWT